MLNLNVTGETGKYSTNMQIYTACHQKYQNKSSLTRMSAIPGLLLVLRQNNCCYFADVTVDNLLAS